MTEWDQREILSSIELEELKKIIKLYLGILWKKKETNLFSVCRCFLFIYIHKNTHTNIEQKEKDVNRNNKCSFL
jgi:hypothetical protein